jgi:hypothetical protein
MSRKETWLGVWTTITPPLGQIELAPPTLPTRYSVRSAARRSRGHLVPVTELACDCFGSSRPSSRSGASAPVGGNRITRTRIGSDARARARTYLAVDMSVEFCSEVTPKRIASRSSHHWARCTGSMIQLRSRGLGGSKNGVLRRAG